MIIRWRSPLLPLVIVFTIFIAVTLLRPSSRFWLQELQSVTAHHLVDAGEIRVHELTDFQQTTWAPYLFADNEVRLKLRLPELQKLGRAVIVLDSRRAVGSQIQAALVGTDGKVYAQVNGETTKPLIFDLLSQDIRVSQIDLIVSGTSETYIEIQDIFLFSAHERSLAGWLLHSWLVYPRSLPAYFFYVLFTLLAVVMSGLVLIKRFVRATEPVLGLASSFLAGLALLGAVGWLTSYIHAQTQFSQTYYLTALLIWMILIWWQTGGFLLQLLRNTDRRLIFTLTGFLIILVGWTFVFEGGITNRLATQHDLYFDNSTRYQASIQPYQSDQVLPYNTAKLFYHGDELQGDYDSVLGAQLVKSRPALLSWAAQPFFRAFGERFFIFQALSLGLVSFLVFAAYFVTVKFFGRRPALLASTLIPASYFLIYLSHLMQVKVLAVVVVSIYLALTVQAKTDGTKLNRILLPVAGVVALLTHYFTIVFLISGALYLFVTAKDLLEKVRLVWLALVLPASLLAIWFLVVGESTGIGLVGDVASTNTAAGSFWQSNFYGRYQNLIGLFQTNPFPEVWNRITGFYKLNLIGMFGVVVSGLVLISLRETSRRFGHLLLCFILVPTLLISLSNGDFHLFGIHIYFAGFLPLVLGIAAWQLFSLSVGWRRLWLSFALTEYLFIFVYYYQDEIYLPLLKGLSAKLPLAWASAVVLGLGLVVIIYNIFAAAQDAPETETRS